MAVLHWDGKGVICPLCSLTNNQAQVSLDNERF